MIRVYDAQKKEKLPVVNHPQQERPYLLVSTNEAAFQHMHVRQGQMYMIKNINRIDNCRIQTGVELRQP